MAQAERAALSTTEVLARVLRTLDQFPDFTLDDALWCYAYEPRCQQARQLVGAAVGAGNKSELIAWCSEHDQGEQRAVVTRLVAGAGPGHVEDVPVSASEPNPPKAGR